MNKFKIVTVLLLIYTAVVVTYLLHIIKNQEFRITVEWQAVDCSEKQQQVINELIERDYKNMRIYGR